MIRSIGSAAKGWAIYADSADFPTVNAYPPIPENEGYVRVGHVGPRGGLSIAPRVRRHDRSNAEQILRIARDRLRREGKLFDPDADQEARFGTFIVELDNGEMRRFHQMPTASAHSRPGAREWAETELESGRASHADFFRARTTEARPGDQLGDVSRPEIYRPLVLSKRGEFPARVLDPLDHLPFTSLTRNEYGNITMNQPTIVRRAYETKRHAIKLVDRAVFEQDLSVHPSDLADAWEVAEDAFEEAGLPLQQQVAAENAEYWRVRSGVSSRRRAKPKRKRR